MRHLAVGALVAVQLLVLWSSYGLVGRMADLLGAHRRETQTDRVGLLAKRLGADVAGLQAQVAAIARGFAGSEARIRGARTSRALEAHLTAETPLVYLAVVDPRGDGTRAGVDLPEFRGRLAVAWRNAMDGRTSLGSPTFSEELQEPLIVLGQPIFHGETRVAGVLVAVASTGSFVASLGLDEVVGTTAFLIDDEGRLIASSNRPPDVPGGVENLEIVEHFRSHGALGRMTMPFSLQRGSAPVGMLGSYARVPGVGWGVIALTDEEAANAAASRLRRRFGLFAAVAAVVAVVLGALAAFGPGRSSELESSTAGADRDVARESTRRPGEEAEASPRDQTDSGGQTRVRPAFLKGLLMLAVVPMAMCVAGLAALTFLSSPAVDAIDRAHDSLRPGLPLREALSVLAELQEHVFVRVEQEPADGSASIQWLGREDELEEFAAAVSTDRPLQVFLAPMGSRQWFTIELDEAGSIRSVSPIEGHAD